MAVQGEAVTSNQIPILIFVPGLGRGEANSADRVADVMASVIDRLDGTMTFGTRTMKDVAAPRGLGVGKTVVDASDQPVLQFFQFDYARVLEAPRSTAAPAVVPGMARSATLAVWAALKWWAALRQPAKTARTKAQLALGLAAALSLIFVALVALWALLVALGLDLPWFAGVLGTEEEVATWTFGIASLGLTITWAALRKKILALAEAAERLIRFAKNHGRTADTISIRLDQAIDELRANGWQGPLHLLGYSFGSLVLFEALHPRINSRLSSKPVEEVASLVTIACPLDLVRLYVPSYVKERHERRQNLAWTNVFNEADIFASNLTDGDDHQAGTASLTIGTVTPTSIRYLDEKIGAFQIFLSGRTHSGYWGGPDDASCFDDLVARWLTAAGGSPQVQAAAANERTGAEPGAGGGGA